ADHPARRDAHQPPGPQPQPRCRRQAAAAAHLRATHQRAVGLADRHQPGDADPVGPGRRGAVLPQRLRRRQLARDERLHDPEGARHRHARARPDRPGFQHRRHGRREPQGHRRGGRLAAGLTARPGEHHHPGASPVRWHHHREQGLRPRLRRVHRHGRHAGHPARVRHRRRAGGHHRPRGVRARGQRPVHPGRADRPGPRGGARGAHQPHHRSRRHAGPHEGRRRRRGVAGRAHRSRGRDPQRPGDEPGVAARRDREHRSAGHHHAAGDAEGRLRGRPGGYGEGHLADAHGLPAL
ncbi:MAG: Flagellar hook-associated protein FlgL, partial [uncultured Blastococcus sp.]